MWSVEATILLSSAKESDQEFVVREYVLTAREETASIAKVPVVV